MDQKPKRKRIAVVAIHGVGDHEQFATAREIGDLLSNLGYKSSNPNAKSFHTPRYAPFTETMQRINVRPVKTDGNSQGFDWSDKAGQKKTWGPMDALARAVFQNKAKIETSDANDNSPLSLDHQFMKGQLVKSTDHGPEDTYQCLRLEGQRVPPMLPPAPDSAGRIAAKLSESGLDLPARDGRQEEPAATPIDIPGPQEKTVHIYEMFWADLSKLGNGFTQIFTELYQVLFHVGSVSVNNVLAAAIHFHGKRGGKEWRRFCGAQWFAAAVLAWPIPILNMYMAALVPVVLAVSWMRTHFSARAEYAAFFVLAGALLTAAAGYILAGRRKFPAGLFPAPLIFLAAGVIAGLSQPVWGREVSEKLCGAIVFALMLSVVWYFVRAYDRRRPGSKTAALWIGLVFTVLLAAILFTTGMPAGSSHNGGEPSSYQAIAIALNAIELGFGLLSVSWILFYGAYVWAHLTGWLAVRAVRGKKTRARNPEYEKARRSRWTAQLVLGLSSIGFILLTLPVWTGIVKVVVDWLPGQGSVTMSVPCVGPNHLNDDPCEPAYSPVRYAPIRLLVDRSAPVRALLKNVRAGPSGGSGRPHASRFRVGRSDAVHLRDRLVAGAAAGLVRLLYWRQRGRSSPPSAMSLCRLTRRVRMHRKRCAFIP